MLLEVGKTYIWNGTKAKLQSRWAQGNHFTYIFDDGRQFNGDPAPMFVTGELKEVIETKINSITRLSPRDVELEKKRLRLLSDSDIGVPNGQTPKS